MKEDSNVKELSTVEKLTTLNRKATMAKFDEMELSPDTQNAPVTPII